MIREPVANFVHSLYRPLHRAGQRAPRKPVAANPPRLARQPDHYPALDNARFVLIALVVAGHLLEPLVDTGSLTAALYRWIYLFHMPAFVLISGALSKPNMRGRRAMKLATGLLVPYLVFQTLYPAWDAWLFGTGWSHDYLTPYWLLWYLVSLACWRLLLPLFARLKFALPLAVTIALAAGVAPWIGYPLSLSRTLVFFPLFLLGHLIGAQRLQWMGRARSTQIVATLVLLTAAAGAWLLRDVDPEWLYAATGYAALGSTPLPGAAARLALLAASAACALAMIALMPRRTRWAGLGRRSLTAYLVHGFLVRGLIAAGAFTWIGSALPQPAQLAMCVVAALLIAMVLSSRAVDKLATPLTRTVPWMAAVGRTLARIRS